VYTSVDARVGGFLGTGAPDLLWSCMEYHFIHAPRKVTALRPQEIHERMKDTESDTSSDEGPEVPRSGAKAQKEHHTRCRVTRAVRAATLSIWNEVALNLLAPCVYRCRVCRKRVSRQRLVVSKAVVSKAVVSKAVVSKAVSKTVSKPATVSRFKGRRCVAVRSQLCVSVRVASLWGIVTRDILCRARLPWTPMVILARTTYAKWGTATRAFLAISHGCAIFMAR
jgi:hypothetical protein